MTVAEFDQLPEPPGHDHELRNGELVIVTRPILNHHLAQKRLMLLLDAASAAGSAHTEFSFRPVPEYNLRIADVAYILDESLAKQNPEEHFRSVPELVVEILSPFNTASEILEKETLCLENGAREFWVSDLSRRQAKVSTADGRSVPYKSGQSIPLFFAPGVWLALDDIFG